MWLNVGFQSLFSRKLSVVITIFALTVSTFVLLAVQQIQQQAKQSFSRSISGVDLVVGARTGQLNLLLSSVFRVGYLTNSVDWQSYSQLKQHKQVKWAVPLSIGDSHKGYRVIGTSVAYFQHFKYGAKQALTFDLGRAFKSDAYQSPEVVLGHQVAQKLGYKIGEQLILSHGLGRTSFTHHDHVQFVVTGILAPTGTPVDQSLHISLSGIELMHDNEGTHHEHQAHQPEQISAVLVGLKAKFATLFVQKYINEFEAEPLMAIVPGVALTELWQIMASVERLLLLISALVLFSSLLGMATMLIASMRERSREIAILRALGAKARNVFALIELEVLLLSTVSILMANGLTYFVSRVAQPFLASQYGVYIEANLFSPESMLLSLIVLVFSLILGALPAWLAYKRALQSSLMVR